MNSHYNLSSTAMADNRHAEQLAPGPHHSRRFKLLLVHNVGQDLQKHIADLRNSGIPAGTEAMLLVDGPFPLEVMRTADEQNKAGTLRRLKEAGLEARAELTAAFPTWEVHAAASPNRGLTLIELARDWQPDLVSFAVADPVWTGNRSFRSLLRKLMSEFRLSVRVARPRSEIWPFRRPVVIAFDDPDGASAVLLALARRRVARATPVQLIFSTAPLISNTVRPTQGCSEQPDKETIARQLLRMQSSLEKFGCAVSSDLRVVDSMRPIVALAAGLNAECILWGRRHQSVLADLATPSIAAELASRAPCSVEILCLPRTQQPAWGEKSLAS